MKRALVTLALLLATVLRAGAGPHPCHSQAGPATGKTMGAPTGHASCHGSQAPAPAKKSAPPKGHDCCDPVKGSHALCDEGCQRAAVLGIASVLPEILSFETLAAGAPDRPSPLFVPSIDHVPLA